MSELEVFGRLINPIGLYTNHLSAEICRLLKHTTRPGKMEIQKH